MSDLNDLIARNATLSYEQGRKDERLMLLRLANEACVHNDNGDYVYLSDLNDYIEEHERERNEKKSRQTQ